jgi:hypothetical protein
MKTCIDLVFVTFPPMAPEKNRPSTPLGQTGRARRNRRAGHQWSKDSHLPCDEADEPTPQFKALTWGNR